MNNLRASPLLNRRRLLKLLAAASITTAGAYGLGEAAPWLDYAEAANHSRQSLVKEATMPAQLRELVRYATLAASGHNAQPWRFAVKDNALEIHPDYTRRLPVVDPDDRELWISLGCALENLLIAARTMGYAPVVTYPETAELIQVQLNADSAQTSPLFAAIPQRQNTRSEYDGQAIKRVDLDQVQKVTLEPGVSLRFITAPSEQETVLEYVNQGNLRQYADPAFVKELIAWLRFNKREAMAAGDGLFSACSGNPQTPRWLGRLFVGNTKPQQQADADAKKLRSSAGTVIIATTGDDRVALVRTGQVYERLALTMTALNIKSAFLNQPIEVSSLRTEFQHALGLNAALPQLVVRFGYAAAMPKSLRRPVEQVIVT